MIHARGVVVPLLAAFALTSLGCGGAVGDDANDLASTSAGLSTSSLSTVTLRRDTRRCRAPLCGGYFAKNAGARTETYVSGLDLTNAHLDAASQEAVLDAPATELVLRGKLSKKDPRTKTQKLLVYVAWRGMPGMTIAAGDGLYTVKDRGITCVTAPCNVLAASRVSGGVATNFARLATEPAAQPFVDTDWLASRATLHGAIVAAHFESGQRFAGGVEKVLSASRLFVKLPEAPGPCPASPQPACGAGERMTFTRTADRCLVADACVTPGICPQFMPACPDGYVLESWPASPNGCPQFACDPAFATP